MVPLESLDTVFYSPSIATMAVSLAVSEIYLTSNTRMTLKSGLWVGQGR